MIEFIELLSEEEGEPQQGCFSGIRKSFASGWTAFKKRLSGLRKSNGATNFEINFELFNYCSQEYQFLKRNACKRVRTLGDRYVIIGPYTGLEMFTEISVCELPPQSHLHAVVEQMRHKGIKVVTGRWNVKGKPLMILFDIESAKDDILKHLRWKMQRNVRLAKFIESNFPNHDEIVFEHRVAEFFTEYNRIIKNQVIAENPFTIHRLLTRQIKPV